MAGHAEKFGKSPASNPAQQTAKEILQFFEDCGIGRVSEDIKERAGITLYSDDQDLVAENLNFEDIGFDEDKTAYISRLVAGMAIGNITVGDSELGKQLFDFANKLKKLSSGKYDEEHEGDPERAVGTTDRKEFERTHRAIDNFRAAVLNGAEQGLFTDGNHFAPNKFRGRPEGHIPEHGA